jgi:hypothetical protein
MRRVGVIQVSEQLLLEVLHVDGPVVDVKWDGQLGVVSVFVSAPDAPQVAECSFPSAHKSWPPMPNAAPPDPRASGISKT